MPSNTFLHFKKINFIKIKAVAICIVLLSIIIDNSNALDITDTYVKKDAIQIKAPTLIPRKNIFSNPEKTDVTISEDGTKIAFLAPLNKALNIWVVDVEDKKLKYVKPITKESSPNLINNYCWSYNNNIILYTRDQKGDENFHIYSIDLKTGRNKNLTPFPKTRAHIIGMSAAYPNDVLIILNKRDSKWFDAYCLNIVSGKLTLIEENQQFIGFVADKNLHLRFATKNTNGYLEYYAKNNLGKWEFYERIPQEDQLSTKFISFNKEGTIAYKVESKGRDKSAIYSLDLKTNKKILLAENSKTDCYDLLVHPYEFTHQAYFYEYTKPKWVVLDKRIKKDFHYLKKKFSDSFEITSRSLTDDKWIVRYYSDTRPSEFYLYKRDPIKNVPLGLDFLFTTRNNLLDVPLAPMYPFIIKARDGLELVAYLTLPLTARPIKSLFSSEITLSKPIPMILFVHGGPWARDSWKMSTYHQWLANRGYAVINVNYRGSTGFGKAFINAGNREWGRKMHNDLIDTVNWAIKHNIADPKKIAIMGYSYGGYATLVGLTFTPDIFCCGVSIVGISNLLTFIKKLPPYLKPTVALLKNRIGDIDTESGRKMLLERSPLTYASHIKKPLLIIHGAHDPRVNKSESEQFVNKVRKNGVPITYVVYHDEGHGINTEQNRLSSHAIIEKFLAENLDGFYEPVENSEVKESNFSVL